MFISYSRKGDAVYARAVISKRVGGKVVKETYNLGRVVDREHNVFRNRERGTFTFDPKTGEYGPAPAGVWPQPAERLVLDFGDAWVLDRLADSEGLWAALDAVGLKEADELRCLVLHAALAPVHHICLVEPWWEGSFARVKYPEARLDSAHVSELLHEVGSAEAQRRFCEAYLAWVEGLADGTDRVSVDFTGLLDSPCLPLTLVAANGEEARIDCKLGFVMERSTGLPVYLRVSVRDISDSEVLDACYARQGAVLFDIDKSDIPSQMARDSLDVFEEALSGQLLLFFCATALCCRLRSRMHARSTSVLQALAAARNQKCKVFDDRLLTCEPSPAAHELYRAIGLSCPVEIPLPSTHEGQE